MEQEGLGTPGLRIMRAGEHQPNRYHPASTGVIIRGMGLNIYWLVWVRAGDVGVELHRFCTR